MSNRDYSFYKDQKDQGKQKYHDIVELPDGKQKCHDIVESPDLGVFFSASSKKAEKEIQLQV